MKKLVHFIRSNALLLSYGIAGACLPLTSFANSDNAKTFDQLNNLEIFVDMQVRCKDRRLVSYSDKIDQFLVTGTKSGSGSSTPVHAYNIDTINRISVDTNRNVIWNQGDESMNLGSLDFDHFCSQTWPEDQTLLAGLHIKMNTDLDVTLNRKWGWFCSPHWLWPNEKGFNFVRNFQDTIAFSKGNLTFTFSSKNETTFQTYGKCKKGSQE